MERGREGGREVKEGGEEGVYSTHRHTQYIYTYMKM